MKKSAYRILVVDDDESIVEMLKYNLQNHGYDVQTAFNGKAALELATDFSPDLVLLDVMMPTMDGLEACRALRSHPTLSGVHIVFLTARTEEHAEIAAFEAGANEYIQKPIKPRVLMSRVEALFRRDGEKKDSSIKIRAGDLLIDRSRYMVRAGGEEMALPKKEFELLAFLAQAPDKVFSRDELLTSIWGADVYVSPRTVDVHIRKIREKIGERRIVTLKGVGYKFQPSS